jgi:ribosomal protein L37AE/L43A
MKKNNYYLKVFQINCPNCNQSYKTTKKEVPHIFRCDKCRFKLSALYWTELGSVRAISREEAIKKYEKKIMNKSQGYKKEENSG